MAKASRKKGAVAEEGEEEGAATTARHPPQAKVPAYCDFDTAPMISMNISGLESGVNPNFS